MEISTSILSCEDRVKAVLELNRTRSSYIHVDVMDGKFVSDVQFDTFEKIHSIDLVSKKKLDIHLMVENPQEYVEKLTNLNIEFITFHVEVKKDIDKIIKSIHDKGYKVGLAIKPETDIKVLEKYLDTIDMILVMSVEPGKGGQEFIHNSVDKICEVKRMIKDKNILIEVDGGINDKTINQVKDVDISVVGSYIVKSDSYYQAVDSLFPKEEEEIDNKKDKNGLGLGWLPVIFGIIAYGFFLFIIILWTWDSFVESISNTFLFLFYSFVLPVGIISIFVFLFYNWKESNKNNKE